MGNRRPLNQTFLLHLFQTIISRRQNLGRGYAPFLFILLKQDGSEVKIFYHYCFMLIGTVMSLHNIKYHHLIVAEIEQLDGKPDCDGVKLRKQ